MMGRKKKKNFWKKKGPIVGYTFGDILQGVLIAILMAISMYYFTTVRLTPTMVFIIVIICFVGIIVAKTIQDVSKYKIK